MSYKDLLERWDKNASTMTYEESEKLEKEIKNEIQKAIEAEEIISKEAIDFLMEVECFRPGEIEEIGRHGWFSQYFIIHLGDKFYRGIGWFNDMCGEEIEEQVLKEVKLKEVKVLKWVEGG